MRTFGLIGYPLSHSFSEKYFTEKFRKENIAGCRYKLFPLKNISALPELILNEPTLCGLNVTSPYKSLVINFLENKDDLQLFYAVNTIKIIRKDGKIVLRGYNTDAPAFCESVKPFIKPHFKSALIIGTGGAARAAAHCLNKDFGIENITFVSRSPQLINEVSYTEINKKEEFSQYDIIINASPAGMFPNVDECPGIPYHFINENSFVFDMIYNPAETLFLKKAKAQCAKTKNGLEMFYLQAEKSWEIWDTAI